MRFDRQSGVFLHPTSLPGPHGIGDLGDCARRFVDFLDRAGQRTWQFCPLGPTTDVHGHSPYQSPSAFAGNPLLVDLSDLADRGYLDPASLEDVPDFPDNEIDYDRVSRFKRARLREAFETFQERADESDRAALESFEEREAHWVKDYALFVALKGEFDERPWTEWPSGCKRRDPDALDRYRESLEEAIEYHVFVQWLFDEQWRRLREYAAERGIALVGDLPLYVALDSADVWASPEAFRLDDDHEPEVVAGVPPNPGDEGQRWGNPVYDWTHLRETGYDWWIDRLHRLFDLVDVTRIDHFKGFDEYWAIPADSTDPTAGEWREGPGADFFETVESEFDDLPFLVEDLGFLDESVHALKTEFDFPGMRVPHYADWCEEGNRHQPMHYPENCVAYTSTHDTDTVIGYYRDLSERQRDCLHYNLGTDGESINWDLIEAVWHSDAVLAFTTVPDLLGLGSEARFNLPGTAGGNWRWRTTDDALADSLADRLRTVTDGALR